jgi:hypothetical protein
VNLEKETGMKRTMAAFFVAAAMASVVGAAEKPKTVTLTGCVRGVERNSFVLTRVEARMRRALGAGRQPIC